MRCPYLKQQGTTKVLMVHDKPFVMLAGELHNSNSSTPEAMDCLLYTSDAADEL